MTVADANAPANTVFSTEVSQANGPAPWVNFSQELTAISDSTLLSFIDTGGAFNAGIYLDDVSVEPVNALPLPAALPLFASGFGGLGALGFWRRWKQVVA